MTKYIKNNCQPECPGDQCPICEAYHNSGDSTCPCCGHETLCLAAQTCDGDIYECNYCGFSEHLDGEDDVLVEVRCPQCNRLICWAEPDMKLDVKCPRCRWQGKVRTPTVC